MKSDDRNIYFDPGKLVVSNHLFIYVFSNTIYTICLPFRLTSRDKAKAMFVKGWLIECNKTGLAALSVIIHKATHGDIRAPPRDNLLLHMLKEKRGQMPGISLLISAFVFCYIDRTFLYYKNQKFSYYLLWLNSLVLLESLVRFHRTRLIKCLVLTACFPWVFIIIHG